MITKKQIINFIYKNNIQDSVVCLHSSLKSFGKVENGAKDIIDAFLESGCTLVCPAFFYDSATLPQKKYKQNAMNFESIKSDKISLYFPSISYEELPKQIDKSMGIIPRTLLTYSKTLRTKNPMNSFCVNGPKSDLIVNGNFTNIINNVYSAHFVYKNIFHDVNLKAFILLAGVDFTSCTPLHFAEEISGKKPFRRWAVFHSNIVETEQGSYSDGFENLRPLLQDLEIKDKVGNCEIRLYEFNKFILKSA